MTVTLTANYKEIFPANVVEKIEELVEDLYDLEAMLTFIDEYNEAAFVEHYEEYVRCGEAIGYEAVDALAAESGIDYITDCDERYQGCEQFCSEMGYDVPSIIVVDWEATWDTSLYYDFTACNDGSSYHPVHIFRDNWYYVTHVVVAQ